MSSYSPCPDCPVGEVPRLTYDESKAAEAAFLGRPFNEAWSEAARRVYVGIRGAMEGGM